jgi:hypothetical protein
MRHWKDLLAAVVTRPALRQAAVDVVDLLRSRLPAGPQVVDCVSYGQIVDYFVTARPDDRRVAKGAILLDDDPRGIALVQVFLDACNGLVCDAEGVPYGRRVVAESLDAELVEVFDGRHLVIVE